jgi:hypothetical protein
MAHSVELLLGPDTDSAVRAEWAALAEAGLPSLALHGSPTNRPHVTLTAAARIDVGADADLAGLADRLPVPCLLGAPVVFGRGTVTLVRLAVPSAALLEFQRAVSEVVAPHIPSGAYPHTEPGRWTPHVTLCRRLPAAQLPAALDVIAARSIEGEFAALRRWDGDARVDHVLS